MLEKLAKPHSAYVANGAARVESRSHLAQAEVANEFIDDDAFTQHAADGFGNLSTAHP